MNKSKDRVLFLVNIPSPYRVAFFNELGKLCDLTVLFERNTSDERESTWFNGSFTNFKTDFLDGTKINKNTALCFSIMKYLKKELFDIIVVGGYATPTGMLAINYLKLRKISFILNADGGLIDTNENFFKRMIKRYYISSAKFYLSTGTETTKYFEQYGANPNRIFKYSFTSLLDKDILDAPLDKDIKEKMKEKLNVIEEKVIISVGRFIYIKGFDVLLKACKYIPSKYGIYIIGGQPTPEYIKLKQDYNLTNVHFIGFKSKKELKEYYMISDLFVLPTRRDVWGLVINEAMANGLPVITTDKCVAGLELVKDNENGFIVPADNTDILEKRISEILEDKNLLEKMGKRSLDKIQKYTIENMAIEHMNIFKTILEEDKQL